MQSDHFHEGRTAMPEDSDFKLEKQRQLELQVWRFDYSFSENGLSFIINFNVFTTTSHFLYGHGIWKLQNKTWSEKKENVIGKACHYQKLKTFIDLIPLFDVFACYACFLGSFEYEKQSICLNGHVSSCVDGVPLLNAFKGEIVKLLELLVYHCGKLSFEVSRINPLILGQVDCDAGKLEGTVGCWDDFRTTFNASRNDSSLCR